ncbi:hypothetical protein Goari_012411 [Gossypium aridum]|uniref:Uncharacterized protein n=1 Tax=Gossypium aridum TaxID=34290 RepID=A0A7J8X0C9_GOSAI|nr:hypothetical protein [Gossypium aridum]
MNAVETLVNIAMGNLTEKNDALKARMTIMKEENEAIVMTLNAKIEELEGDLAMCRTVVMSSQLLHFNGFRRELANSGFEWHFGSNHNSSVDSSTTVSFDLHLDLV